MTNNIKVSIIVPVYNVKKYLSKCLGSLRDQTLKEIEIICVNDGSTDGSDKLLNTLAKYDSRIVIINQENQGLSAARNAGIKIAKGEYIGFVDSDDWVDIDFYEKLYNAAKKFDCDIASGDFYRQGKILKTQRLKYKKTEAFFDPIEKIERAFIPQHCYVWNKIYKKDALLGIDHQFPIGRYYEDMFWTVQVVYKLNGLITVPNTFYHYRKNECVFIKENIFSSANKASSLCFSDFCVTIEPSFFL